LLNSQPGAVGPNTLAGGAYLADQDGPLLVSLARAVPPLGDAFLSQYLAVHTAYSYVEYRRGSLWSLLGAMLLHPERGWLLKLLPAVGGAALAGGVDFQEGLIATLLSLLVVENREGAAAELEAHRRRVLAGVERLAQPPGASDSWGIHKRRLASLAEAMARILDQPAEASALLSRALSIRYGFAGFQAPACLAVAEAIQVVRSGDDPGIPHALDAALTAAHNIQDPTFCARTTARVNAMRARWWGPHPNRFDTEGVSAVVERFCAEPTAEEFTALHTVGEAYLRRAEGTGLLLPPSLREARTLETLAAAYRRPLRGFQRVNRGLGVTTDDELHDGTAGRGATSVNVPDPGFAPLLAARLAAQVLADASLSAGERTSLIRRLVPIAASNPTALDAVLSRLMLAGQPAEPSLFDELLEAAKRTAAASGADLDLAGELTTYVP
jgi:hypothetical protein